MLLTTTQMAAKLEIAPSTLKRWYEFYHDLDEEEIKILENEYNMPKLPEYATAGTRGDRLWNEADIYALLVFKDWVPPTRSGIFQKFKKEEN